MRSLDGVLLEDLMELWRSNFKPMPWNHAYIDEDIEICCYSS